ncbi:hypothetical protein CAOG_08728, partial [Capsaspora owczarzaki ATCC 30864]|uniref:hypothetical protein n=1 Tax=Capsaspora owczarzaki (strain ATCC 30864) TaxID=595528 RepID=UPI0003524D84
MPIFRPAHLQLSRRLRGLGTLIHGNARQRCSGKKEKKKNQSKTQKVPMLRFKSVFVLCYPSEPEKKHRSNVAFHTQHSVCASWEKTKKKITMGGKKRRHWERTKRKKGLWRASVLFAFPCPFCPHSFPLYKTKSEKPKTTEMATRVRLSRHRRALLVFFFSVLARGILWFCGLAG